MGKCEYIRIVVVQEDQNIWEQFPLICPVVAEVAGGLPAKVVIHKGSLRVGAGHHHIVEPALAEAYFSKACSGPACEIVMKLYKQRTSVDIYDQTPYSRSVIERISEFWFSLGQTSRTCQHPRGAYLT